MKTKPPRGSTPQPDHIMLSLNGDASTCRAITWRTSEEITEGYVEYWQAGSQEVLRAEGSHDRFESDIDVSQIHWVHLKDLTPGAQYEYTCGDSAHRAGPFGFCMPPADIKKCKFLCFSDQQKGEPFDLPDYSEFQAFVKDLLRQHPDVDFILTAGDNTDSGQHEQQWNALFDTGWKGIAEHVPVMMTLGNHDNRGFADYRNGIGRYYSEPGEFFCKQFQGAYPNNGPAGWETENYLFTFGNVQINVLGLTGDEERNTWMLETAGNTPDDIWKLGVFHFPVTHGGADTEINDYPPLEDGIACFDVMFGGHEHHFARSFPFKKGELYDKPSQGTVHYTLGNSNRNPPGTKTLPKVWHNAFYAMEDRVSAVCIAQAEGQTLTLTSMLNDGRILDRCVIDKEHDEILPPAAVPYFGPGRTRMMFRGADLGICQSDTLCEQKDGQWFCALAVLATYIGADVRKTPGQCRLEGYGRWAVFTEGSGTAQTDRGSMQLPAPVYRGKRGQLYIPVQGCEALDMTWEYAAHNNFINFEHPSEAKLITEQP